MVGAKGASSALTAEALERYSLPEVGEKEVGYDARVEWSTTASNLLLIASFRTAVLKQDSKAIVDAIQGIRAVTTVAQVERITSLLFDRSLAEPTKEALLTAICVGSRPFVELILPLFYEFPGEERRGCVNSRAFPPHITPIMLACICNNFAIVECLLLRNHYVDLPHRPDCYCDDCEEEERLGVRGIVRRDRYRAVCSDAFLWLGTADPMLAACRLCADLNICEELDEDYKNVYSDLRNSVTAFSVDLVQHCWTKSEVDILLGRRHGSCLTEAALPLPRLRLALDARMKNFVGCLNVQSAVNAHWFGSWTKDSVMSSSGFKERVLHTVLYPIGSIIHAVSARKCLKCFDNPVGRYTSKTTSYAIFLLALLYLQVAGRNIDNASNRHVRMTGFELGLEFYVYAYVFTFSTTHYQDFANRGLENYFDLWWRWFDLITLWMFSGSFYCWVMTVIEIYSDGLPKLHRRHWVSYDFSLIYDIYFGGACIMAFWRVFYFVQMERFIGPTIIAVTRCVREIMIFLSIMAMVMLCFSFGINTIYQPYTGSEQINSKGEVETVKESYRSVAITFRSLYWSFYGYLGPWDYTLIVGNAGPDQLPTDHILTAICGELIVGIFHMTVVITILNLMVAMLVRTADRIQSNEDIEFKYIRTHICSEYFAWYTCVPPPFNFISVVTEALHKLIRWDKYTFIFPDLVILKELVLLDVEVAGAQDREYEELLRVLFGRYQCSHEYHYNAAYKSDSEKVSRSQSLHTPKPVMMFMNACK